jgi:hypothetical protein
MLARDPIEATEQAQEFLKTRPLLAYYEEILIEGLKLAQADAERGLLDNERMLCIRDAVAEIVDDLSAHEDKAESLPQVDAAAEKQTPLAQINRSEELSNPTIDQLREQWRTAVPVLCIPGVGLLDEAVALIVAQLITREGIGARTEQADALSMSRIFSLDTKDIALVCLCYVENATAAQIRYAVRRLRRRAPKAFILVALVGTTTIDEEAFKDSADIDFVKQSLQLTVEKVLALSGIRPREEALRPVGLEPNLVAMTLSR